MHWLKSSSFFFFTSAFLLVLESSPRLAFAAGEVDSALKGTWKSICMDLGSSTYIVTTATFDGAGNSNDKVVFYKDAACSAPTGLVKTNSKVAYSIGPRMGQQGDLDLYPIDVTIQSSALSQNGSVIKSGGPLPKQYDVLAIKGDTLYLSALDRNASGPITSPIDRPTKVDTKNIFTRQK